MSSTPLHRVREALYRDDARRRPLIAARDADALGIALSRSATPDPDLRRALERALAGPAPPRATLPPDARDWYPGAWAPDDLSPGESAKGASAQGHATLPGRLRWHYLGGVDFRDAFYFDTARKAGYRPLNRLLDFRAPLDVLAPFVDDASPAPLAGVVLHMSRCGSTWLGRLLAHDPGHLVLLEPMAFDAVLRAPLDPATQIRWLRALVAVFARPRERGPHRLFLKLDAWHTRALPLLRAAFPGTPFLFLHRKPLEVLVSHRRQRGRHVVPGLIEPAWFGGDPPAPGALDEHAAWVLARILEPVLADPALTCVDYADLRAHYPTRIAALFGIAPTTARRALDAIGARDAKVPGATFVDDRDSKHAAADASLRAIARRRLDGLHERLRARSG